MITDRPRRLFQRVARLLHSDPESDRMRIRGAGAVLALSWLAQTLADASGGNADLVVRYANEKKRFFRVSRG